MSQDNNYKVPLDDNDKHYALKILGILFLAEETVRWKRWLYRSRRIWVRRNGEPKSYWFTFKKVPFHYLVESQNNRVRYVDISDALFGYKGLNLEISPRNDNELPDQYAFELTGGYDEGDNYLRLHPKDRADLNFTAVFIYRHLLNKFVLHPAKDSSIVKNKENVKRRRALAEGVLQRFPERFGPQTKSWEKVLDLESQDEENHNGEVERFIRLFHLQLTESGRQFYLYETRQWLLKYSQFGLAVIAIIISTISLLISFWQKSSNEHPIYNQPQIISPKWHIQTDSRDSLYYDSTNITPAIDSVFDNSDSTKSETY